MQIENLQKYIGTKLVEASPMNLGPYNTFRGWDIPKEESPTTPGYIVKYPDGYISWSPKKQFEDANRLTTNMNFGLAVEAMKKGAKVSRAGWNGIGMFVFYVPGTKKAKFNPGTPYAVALKHIADAHGYVEDQEILPHFDMYTVNAEGRRAMLPGWLASQSDINADDWEIVE